MTGSLSTAGNFVESTDKALAKTETPFTPEATDLGTLGFVSWIRTGVAAAAVTPPADGKVRATATAAFNVVPDVGTPVPVTREVALYGPGDVIGIGADQVVRCHPQESQHIADDGTLAHIEFDDPTLPWAFSPVAAEGDKLQPWIALVVVDVAKCTFLEGQGGFPPRLTVDASELQPAADSWAWAHAQVQGATSASPSLADRLSDAYGDQNLSRLICPRRLNDGTKTGTQYLACVVPTFDVGARAGQDKEGGTLGPAWGASGSVTLPVYFSWTFVIGPTIDFEALAKKLEPARAPASVGRRSIDMSHPGGPLAPGPSEPGAIQMLDCALHSPVPAAKTGGWSAVRTATLRKAVERGLKTANSNLPRVSPRAYAQFQRGATKLSGDKNDWFDALNTQPLNRLVAGIGTRVVQRDSDKLIEAAWNQVAELEPVNTTVIEPAQFGRYVAEAVVKKGEDRMDLGALVGITQRVHGKLDWGIRTLAGEISLSALPMSATTAAYRRMLAAGGTLARTVTRVSGVQAPFAKMLAAGEGKLTDMRRTYTQPDAIAGLSKASIAMIPADRAKQLLGANYAARLASFTSPIDQAGAENSLGDLAGKLQGKVSAGRLNTVERVLSGPGVTAGMREALGSVLAGALDGATPEVAKRMQTRIGEIHAAVPMDIGSHALAQPTATAQLRSAQLKILPPVMGRGTAQPMNVRSQVIAPAPSAVSRFTTRLQRNVVAQRPARISAEQFGTAFRSIAHGTIVNLAGTPERKTLALTRASILDAVAPRKTARAALKARLDLGLEYSDWFEDGSLKPLVVSGPRFERPMYEALLDYDRNWLVPGLGAIDKENFVTLLVSNARFIESFMAGLSDEMGRELLWRRFPTDRRATYFHRFWNAWKDELSPDINQWPADALGTHLVPKVTAEQAAAGQAGDRVVLLVRGELIRRIPSAVIVAVQRDGEAFGVPPASGTGAALFRARLAPDTLVVGFDLTLDQVANPAGGHPWWFFITEHPGAPRFGLDTVAQTKLVGADDLDWTDLPLVGGNNFLSASGGQLGWGQNAATNARLLLQSPVRVAFEASRLIGDIHEDG